MKQEELISSISNEVGLTLTHSESHNQEMYLFFRGNSELEVLCIIIESEIGSENWKFKGLRSVESLWDCMLKYR